MFIHFSALVLLISFLIQASVFSCRLLLPGVKLNRVTDIGFMHNPLVSDDVLSLNVLWISNMLKLKLNRPTYAYGILVYCAVGFPYLLK